VNFDIAQPGIPRFCMAKLAQGTRREILARQDIKSHKVRYDLVSCDQEVGAKWEVSASIVSSNC
jgi:hypothetical protein